VAVLAGWQWRLGWLTGVLPGAVQMKPNTAVCMLVLGVGLRCIRPGSSRRVRRLGVCSALLVGVVAVTTLLEYALRTDLGIDLLLFEDAPDLAFSSRPGRMGPNTAAALLLLAAAQLCAVGGRAAAAQILSLGAGAIGMLGLYGYAFRVPEFESPVGVTGMAMHTALGVTIAAAGTLAARPTAGPARMLLVRARSAMLTRRMLLATLLVLPLLGWLRLFGERAGLYGPALGIALLIVVNVAFFMGFIWITGARTVRLEMSHQRAEAALAWQRAAAAMAEAAPEAMVGVDTDGLIVLVNGQAERMFGYRREEMVGQSVDLLVPEQVRAAHPAQRATYLRDPRIRKLGAGSALAARRRDGTEIPVEISVSALDAGGRRLVVVALRDVAERLRFEEQLREKNLQLEQAGQAKDTFLAAMSHELRTPLNAIIGFTGILLMGLPGPLNEEQTHQLRLVEAGSQHLLSLINDVLDLAKIELGKLELSPRPVDCAEAAREIAASLRPQAEHKGLTLTADLPPEPCIATVDRRALDQILINLIGNAIKFTTAGEVRIALTRAGPAAPWTLAVSDTGPGIDPAEQERIFAAFHRTRDAHSRGDDGAGLGLYISRTLAELMGCRMHLTSSPGDGSTFTLTLAC
jgi:PAS domain S-box-containing protein